MKRVWSLLLMAVLPVIVSFASDMHKEQQSGSFKLLPRDTLSVIISFLKPSEWFTVLWLNHDFFASMQQGIASAFQFQGNPIVGDFILRACKSDDLSDYQALIDRYRNKIGERCAIRFSDSMCTVIDGGREMVDEVQLRKDSDRASKTIQSPIPFHYSNAFRISDRMMGLHCRRGAIALFNVDFEKWQSKRVRAMKDEVYLNGENGRIKAGEFSREGSLRLLFEQNNPIGVKSLDTVSLTTRVWKLAPKGRAPSISPDGRTVIQFEGQILRVFNTPLIEVDHFDENLEWEEVKQRYLRFETYVSDVSQFVCFSPASKYALIRYGGGLLNVMNGEITQLSGDIFDLEDPWINGDTFISVNKYESVLRCVNNPRIDLSVSTNEIRREQFPLKLKK